MRAELDAVLATAQPQQLEVESRTTGEPRTYRLSKLPMALDGGPAPTHVITVGEDVTSWKAAIGRTAQAEKLAAVGQLAAGVMHEINNPLGTIAACAETMTLALAELPPGVPQPPGFGEYLRIIDHEVHRCRRIAEGLLEFSRAKTVRAARLDLDDVAERTLTLLKHHTRFKGCPVRLDFAAPAPSAAEAPADGAPAPAPAPAVLGDPDQLTQVLMVLLLNAADAVAAAPARDADDAPRGVTVRTRATRAGEALLEVEDEGVGIPRDALGKLFEPFYTTKAPGRGHGAGARHRVRHRARPRRPARGRQRAGRGQPVPRGAPGGLTPCRRSRVRPTARARSEAPCGCSSPRTRSTSAPWSRSSSAGAGST
jgi:two-component system NtrC family sensor kinase